MQNFTGSDQSNAIGKIGSCAIILILVSGVVGNLAVFITICRARSLRKVQHYVLVASLAFSDCTFNSIIMPFYIKSWWNNSVSHSATLCYVYTYIGTILLQLSGNIIVFIAFNRYLLVAHVKLYKKFECFKATTIQIVLAVIGSIATMASSFDNMSNKVLFQTQISRCNFHRAEARAVIYTIFVNISILPLATMIVLYIVIIVKLRKMKHKVGNLQTITGEELETCRGSMNSVCKTNFYPNTALSNQASSKAVEIITVLLCCKKASRESDPASIHGVNALARKEYLRKVKVAKSLLPIFLVLVAHFITYLPFTLINMVDTDYTLQREYYMISNLFFWCSSCVNPWIYGVMNKELNAAIKRTIRSLKNAFSNALCICR